MPWFISISDLVYDDISTDIEFIKICKLGNKKDNENSDNLILNLWEYVSFFVTPENMWVR